MLTYSMTGGDSLMANLRGMPKKVLDEVQVAISEGAARILARAKQKVSGPRPKNLGNVTGTLRRKLNAKVTRSDTAIEGIVGIMLSYAAVHEFGFSGQGASTVKAHTRRNLHQVKEATSFRKLKDGTRVAYVGNKAKGHGVIPVKSHSRKWRMEMPERSFLRSAFRELKPSIEAAIEAAVGRGLGR